MVKSFEKKIKLLQYLFSVQSCSFQLLLNIFISNRPCLVCLLYISNLKNIGLIFPSTNFILSRIHSSEGFFLVYFLFLYQNKHCTSSWKMNKYQRLKTNRQILFFLLFGDIYYQVQPTSQRVPLPRRESLCNVK